VLTGAWELDRTRFREAAHYAELGVRLLNGRAGALDVEDRTVYLADGYALGFDGLIIATGVRPRRLLGQRSLAGVHVLRDQADAAGLRAAFAGLAAAGGPAGAAGPGNAAGLESAAAGAGRVVIVGGGFLGLEVAASARSLGLEVTVIEPLEQPMIRQVGPLVGAEVARLHREHGVDLRTGIGVAKLRSDDSATGAAAPTAEGGRVTGVALTDGTVVAADCVLVAVGAVPDTDWLASSGLPLGDGVECDQYCRAAPGIYAAGDVASWFNPRYQRRMRVEHRMNATEQGAAAARNLLLGDVEPFAPLPYFWSDQYQVKIQVHGYPSAQSEAAIEEGSPADGKFVVLYRADGAPVAVLGWNAMGRMPRYRKSLLG
jgi:3-phenylpropionate/trans-cinnamate dioxygenase ferredoxin reductase component